MTKKNLFMWVVAVLMAGNAYAVETINNPGNLKIEKLETKKFKGRVEHLIPDDEGNPQVVEEVQEETVDTVLGPQTVKRKVTKKKVLFLKPDGTTKKELLADMDKRESIRISEDGGVIIKLTEPALTEKGTVKNKGDKVKLEFYNKDGVLVLKDEIDWHQGYTFSNDYSRYIATEGGNREIYLRDSVNKKEKRIMLFDGDFEPYWLSGVGVEFSPDGRLFGASACKKADNTDCSFILYDRDGNEVWRRQSKSIGGFITFSANNSYILNGGTIFTKNGDNIGYYEIGGARLLSPDESYFVYRFGSKMGLIETEKGREVWSKEATQEKNIEPVAITTDSQFIIYATRMRILEGGLYKRKNPGFLIIDRTGNKIFEYEKELDPASAPLVRLKGNKVYFIADGEIQIFSVHSFGGRP